MKENSCGQGTELRNNNSRAELRLNQLEGEYQVTSQEADMTRSHNDQLLEHGSDLKQELAAL